MNDLFTD
jgi:amino acid transporter